MFNYDQFISDVVNLAMDKTLLVSNQGFNKGNAAMHQYTFAGANGDVVMVQTLFAARDVDQDSLEMRATIALEPYSISNLGKQRGIEPEVYFYFAAYNSKSLRDEIHVFSDGRYTSTIRKLEQLNDPFKAIESVFDMAGKIPYHQEKNVLQKAEIERHWPRQVHQEPTLSATARKRISAFNFTSLRYL